MRHTPPSKLLAWAWCISRTEAWGYPILPIGILCWAVEIGHIHILLEVSIMSTHLALPQIGHLGSVLHIICYLKKNPKKALALNVDSQSRIGQTSIAMLLEQSHLMPWPHMISMCPLIVLWMPATLVVRSHLVLKLVSLYLLTEPLSFGISKRQNTIEASTFGSEFIALKTATEQIEALPYKLSMFGIPVEGLTKRGCYQECYCPRIHIVQGAFIHLLSQCVRGCCSLHHLCCMGWQSYRPTSVIYSLSVPRLYAIGWWIISSINAVIWPRFPSYGCPRTACLLAWPFTRGFDFSMSFSSGWSKWPHSCLFDHFEEAKWFFWCGHSRVLLL